MYGEVVVVQFLTVGMKKRENEIFEILQTRVASKAIYEVGRTKHQREEGIVCQTRIARGGETEEIVFLENGIEFEADISEGQKTGFYFDQRDNRQAIARMCVDRGVLDLFCYSGPFSICALVSGASSCTCVDSSMRALMAAEKNARRNHVEDRIRIVNKNVQTYLTDAIIKEEKFDVVIVDPPNFAHTVKDKESALKAYKKLNAYAIRVTRSGGLVATSCCSGQVSMTEFLRILGMASREANVTMRIVDTRGAAPDHPFSPAFEQGRYLKFVVGEIRT